MSQPGFFFYPGDYLKDTAPLSLPAQGAWMKLLCILWEHKGFVTWEIQGFMSFWGISKEMTVNILGQLVMYKIGLVCAGTVNLREGFDALPGIEPEFSWAGYKETDRITVGCRRMIRTWMVRDADAKRKKDQREAGKNAHVQETSENRLENVPAKSRPSSQEDSISSSSSISQKTSLIFNAKQYPLPDYINQESWERFVQMRARIGKPLDTYSCPLVIQRLAQFKVLGDDPNECLDRSARTNTSDVWPSKKGGLGDSPTRSPVQMIKDLERKRGDN